MHCGVEVTESSTNKQLHHIGEEGFECSASQGHDATARGDPDLIHVLFDTGVDINKPDGRTGRSPLWQAPTGM
jgi:hypothetical protein